MRYVIDHDFHIHSNVSISTNHPEQTKENILKYAEENGLRKIVITDHFWDREIPLDVPPLKDGSVPMAVPYYEKQDYCHIKQILPLPQGKNTEFLFGAEAEMDHRLKIGLGSKPLSELDFIVIPTTHFHMKGFAISEDDCETPEKKAGVWVDKFKAVLSAKLPFKKVGLAHLACYLMAETREELIEVLRLLPEDEMRKLFRRAAELGFGIEINQCDFKYNDNEAEVILRPFLIAKSEGCKFYLGSDSHSPDNFRKAIIRFNTAIDDLSLKESDKFIL